MSKLLDLKTDLKSLKYGDKPYVAKDLNNPPGHGTGLDMQISKRADDLSRITQMFIDRPGLKFIGNQALLQQADITDKIEKEKEKNPLSFGKQLLQKATSTVIDTTKVIGSTLAQVPVNGTGTHFLYGFRTNTYLQPLGDVNTPAFLEFFGKGGVEGAPLAKRGKTIEGKTDSELDDSQSASPLSNQASGNTVKERSREVNPENLQSKTINNFSEGDLTYEKVEQRGEVENNLSGSRTQTQLDSGTSSDISIQSSVQPEDLQPLTITTLSEENNYKKFISGSGNFENGTSKLLSVSGSRSLRQNIDNEPIIEPVTQPESLESLTSGSFTERNKYLNDLPRAIKGARLGPQQGRAGRGLGTNGKAKISYNRDLGLGDKVNLLDVVEGNLNNSQIGESEDIIKFAFNIITPETNYRLHFRAFLDDFSDNFNGSWSTTKFIGRAEDIYSYEGFSRDISIGFKIAAFSRAELQPLYKKLVTLASVTAPTYGSGQFMRGSFAEVTVGDYLVDTPGIIDNVSISWQKDYPWEIKSDKELDTDVQVLPHVLDVSLKFKVIHNFVAETGTLPYITNDKVVGDKKYIKTHRKNNQPFQVLLRIKLHLTQMKYKEVIGKKD